MKPPTAPRIRARNRAQRCYELVGKAMMEIDPKSGWSAVQGTYQHGFGHSWLEHATGYAFDVVTLEMMSTPQYYESTGARPLRRYGQRDLAREISKAGHWGPFGSEPAAHGLK